MKNFCIITNSYKDKKLAVTGKIMDYITKNGGRVKSLITGESWRSGRDFDPEEIPEKTECVMVLGGDGTIIRAATRIQQLNIPLIGVNLGHLGYLCELDQNTVCPAIDKLMNNAYVREERMMLDGRSSNVCSPRLCALNDIVIHRAGELSMLVLNVYVNGEFLSTYHSDGIIVATPTGATGYNLSAGGPIVDPRARMILLTPINAHNLNARSIVLSGDAVVEVELVSREPDVKERAAVSFDGDCAVDIEPGERFAISAAKSMVGILRLNKESFLEVMRRKMEST